MCVALRVRGDGAGGGTATGCVCAESERAGELRAALEAEPPRGPYDLADPHHFPPMRATSSGPAGAAGPAGPTGPTGPTGPAAVPADAAY